MITLTEFMESRDGIEDELLNDISNSEKIGSIVASLEYDPFTSTKNAEKFVRMLVGKKLLKNSYLTANINYQSLVV